MNIYNVKALKHPVIYIKQLSKLRRLNKKSKIELHNKKIWYQSFKHFLLAQPDKFEVVEYFYKDEIWNVSRQMDLKDERLKVITIVKNDLLKIKQFIEYHREIGIKHFVILDNNSTDGTKEWLSNQDDIDLYSTKERYTTNRREAWINILISIYGFNQWYLILDSDELFTYIDQENITIYKFIELLENKYYKRVKCVMIDMYSDKGFYESSIDESQYIEKCNLFDSDSYNSQSSVYLDLVTGGPRERVFGISPWLTKYSLIYFEPGDVQGNSHYPFPFIKNKNAFQTAYIRHYKFLPSDMKKYKQIVIEGNYYNGSEEYKRYIKELENDNMNFVYDGSREYRKSKDLLVLEEIFKNVKGK